MIVKYLNFNTKISKIYADYCAPVCKMYGINQTELDILMFLRQYPARNTARDIREYRMIKSSLLSVMIEKLIRAGYLLRQNDQSDRRIQRLRLTPRAEHPIRDGISAQARFESAIFGTMASEELRALETLLQKISGAADRLETESISYKQRGIQHAEEL